LRSVARRAIPSSPSVLVEIERRICSLVARRAEENSDRRP
jgi:hypothetical protein